MARLKNPRLPREADAIGTPDDPRSEAILSAAATDALEALAPLDPPLLGAREAELVRFDPEYVEARRGFDAVAVELAVLGAASVDPAAATPSPSLKDRLLARVAAEGARADERAARDADFPEASFLVKAGVMAVRSAEARWVASGLPGVAYKVLGRDRERGITTRLLRLAPGVEYPKHAHAGLEEIYILEGRVRINGVVLGPGDYCRSEAGTEESGTFTETGAMALVVSCDRDEIVLPSA